MSKACAAMPSAIVRCGALSPSSLFSRSSSSSAWPRITRTSWPYVRACSPQNVDRPPAVPAPPRNPYRSSSSVEHPARPAAVAAMIPAGPPPTTTTSNSPYTGVRRLGSVITLVTHNSWRVGWVRSGNWKERPVVAGTWPDRDTTGGLLLLLLFFDFYHHGRAVDGAERLDDRRHAGVRRPGHHDLDRVRGDDQLHRGVRVGRRLLRDRVRMVGGQPPVGSAGYRLLAGRGELPVAAVTVLDDGLAQVLLGPAGLVEQPRVFGVQHHVAAGTRPHQRAGAAERVGEVRRELLGSRGVPGLDVQHRADDARGDCAVIRADAVISGQAGPGTVLLVLPDAAGVLGRRALRGLVEYVGLESKAVDRAEPDRPADRRVGPEARAPHVAPAVQPDPLPDRAVDHDEPCGPRGGLPDRPGHHPVTQERVPGGHHDGEVLRQAAG